MANHPRRSSLMTALASATRPVSGENTEFTASSEGEDWSRHLHLTRRDGRWSCVTQAKGAPNLASFDGAQVLPPAPPGFSGRAAFDDATYVDLGGSPLTNSIPVRQLRMLDREPGWSTSVHAAWVLPPTLEVVPSLQTYTVTARGRIAYGDAATSVIVDYDEDGWVTTYDGLARRLASDGEPTDR
ncbi:putative glycolipid-binding domain-containing protein [Microbacterium sp. 179-I 3D3 NHS]|uniref:putative glycolipid-binding domain-containing protein n=1 Tax=Microbacterium sp. 179-I 3D3 NHS TaxID=3142382 RepID=UPI0039A25243